MINGVYCIWFGIICVVRKFKKVWYDCKVFGGRIGFLEYYSGVFVFVIVIVIWNI